MKLPDTMKIGGIEYKVTCRTTDKKMGHCCSYKCELVVDDKITSRQRQNKVLIHEILHAMFFESGIKLWKDDDEEETVITQLEAMLYDLLANNNVGWAKE